MLDQGLWPIFRALSLTTDVIWEFLPILIDKITFHDCPFKSVVGMGDERRVLAITELLEHVSKYVQFARPLNDHRALLPTENQFELMLFSLFSDHPLL